MTMIMPWTLIGTRCPPHRFRRVIEPHGYVPGTSASGSMPIPGMVEGWAGAFVG